MEIGQKVWIFDSNRRSYEDDKGNKTIAPWYRGCFVEKYILGETKQSWVVGYEESDINSKRNIKVSKKTLTYQGSFGLDGKLYLSEEIINQTCWINDNRYEISEKVRKCEDYNKLKQIEEILNSL